MLSRLTNIARSPGDPTVVKTGPGTKTVLDHTARGLGWFSLGLGMAELVAPRRFTRALGLEGLEPLVRAYGARELAAGRTCLSVDSATGAWSRVAGDAVDLATLAFAFSRADRRQRRNVGVAFAVVVGITALDAVVAQGLAARKTRAKTPVRNYRDRSGWPNGRPNRRAEAIEDMRESGPRMAMEETEDVRQPVN